MPSVREMNAVLLDPGRPIYSGLEDLTRRLAFAKPGELRTLIDKAPDPIRGAALSELQRRTPGLGLRSIDMVEPPGVDVNAIEAALPLPKDERGGLPLPDFDDGFVAPDEGYYARGRALSYPAGQNRFSPIPYINPKQITPISGLRMAQDERLAMLTGAVRPGLNPLAEPPDDDYYARGRALSARNPIFFGEGGLPSAFGPQREPEGVISRLMRLGSGPHMPNSLTEMGGLPIPNAVREFAERAAEEWQAGWDRRGALIAGQNMPEDLSWAAPQPGMTPDPAAAPDPAALPPPPTSAAPARTPNVVRAGRGGLPSGPVESGLPLTPQFATSPEQLETAPEPSEQLDTPAGNPYEKELVTLLKKVGEKEDLTEDDKYMALFEAGMATMAAAAQPGATAAGAMGTGGMYGLKSLKETKTLRAKTSQQRLENAINLTSALAKLEEGRQARLDRLEDRRDARADRMAMHQDRIAIRQSDQALRQAMFTIEEGRRRSEQLARNEARFRDDLRDFEQSYRLTETQMKEDPNLLGQDIRGPLRQRMETIFGADHPGVINLKKTHIVEQMDSIIRSDLPEQEKTARLQRARTLLEELNGQLERYRSAGTR